MKRCCNLDWLEVFCLEDTSVDYTLDGFAARGYVGNARDYGTRVYQFVYYIQDDHGNNLLEVRRSPFGADFLPSGATHIRLTNRSCYLPNPIEVLRDFIVRNHYHLQRISRVDICLDFEKFDSGDKPQDFIQRYLKGKYSKINQCNIHSHGVDNWNRRDWNSISWGSNSSCVTTKMYNKSLELQQVHDKEHIRFAWYYSGLVSDPVSCVRFLDDGTQYTPEIWRIEFSIKSNAPRFFTIDDHTKNKEQKKRMPNTLDCYDTPDKLFNVWASLSHYYFHFKHFETGVRKDRCKDKQLFRFHNVETYKMVQLPTSSRKTSLTRLIMAIEKLKSVLPTELVSLNHIQAMIRAAIYQDTNLPNKEILDICRRLAMTAHYKDVFEVLKFLDENDCNISEIF